MIEINWLHCTRLRSPSSKGSSTTINHNINIQHEHQLIPPLVAIINHIIDILLLNLPPGSIISLIFYYLIPPPPSIISLIFFYLFPTPINHIIDNLLLIPPLTVNKVILTTFGFGLAEPVSVSLILWPVGLTVDIFCLPVSTGDTVNGTLQVTENNVMIIKFRTG